MLSTLVAGMVHHSLYFTATFVFVESSKRVEEFTAVYIRFHSFMVFNYESPVKVIVIKFV